MYVGLSNSKSIECLKYFLLCNYNIIIGGHYYKTSQETTQLPYIGKYLIHFGSWELLDLLPLCPKRDMMWCDVTVSYELHWGWQGCACALKKSGGKVLWANSWHGQPNVIHSHVLFRKSDECWEQKLCGYVCGYVYGHVYKSSPLIGTKIWLCFPTAL